MARLLCLIASVLLFCSAASISPSRHELATVGANLVRPALLPVLWRGLESARMEGTPEEYALRGEALMRLIPHWIDGHVHLAGFLAFNASLAQKESSAALDRLLAGLDLLDRARAVNPAPAAQEELLRCQSRLLAVRCSLDEELAAAYFRRTGTYALSQAGRYLRRIPGFEQSAHLKATLAFNIVAGLDTEIRLGEHPDRLSAEIRTAIDLLRNLPDEDLAQWRSSLRNLDSYLRNSDDITLGALAKDVRLEKIVEALKSAKASKGR